MTNKSVRDILNGNEYWTLNGELHREDGPAIVFKNGMKMWYFNGELHKKDGPAVTFPNGKDSKWHFAGELIDCNSQEEFERLLKLKAFW